MLSLFILLCVKRRSKKNSKENKTLINYQKFEFKIQIYPGIIIFLVFLEDYHMIRF